MLANNFFKKRTETHHLHVTHFYCVWIAIEKQPSNAFRNEEMEHFHFQYLPVRQVAFIVK